MMAQHTVMDLKGAYKYDVVARRRESPRCDGGSYALQRVLEWKGFWKSTFTMKIIKLQKESGFW